MAISKRLRKISVTTNEQKRTVNIYSCHCCAFDLEIICRTHININSQEHLAYYFFAGKFPSQSPRSNTMEPWANIWGSKHWASSAVLRNRSHSVFLPPASTSRGCLHRCVAQHGGAPETQFSPSWNEARGLQLSHTLSGQPARSVLPCLSKEFLGVLQPQPQAHVGETKDTAWNVPQIKQQRMRSQRVNNKTPYTERMLCVSRIHTAAPRNRIFSWLQRDLTVQEQSL